MVIARILHGSSIDRQGMLHTGDVILEVDGREVGSSPHELQELLKGCSGSVVLKVLPSYKDAPAPPQVRKGRGRLVMEGVVGEAQPQPQYLFDPDCARAFSPRSECQTSEK